MSKYTFITAAVLAVVGSGAMAQGITGGSIGVEVTQPTDFNDLVGTNYFGAIEYGISRQFAVSADVSSYRFDSFDQDATSATLHGVYHISDSASLGVYFGQDKREDESSVNIYGVEGGTEFMGGEIEAYVGMVDNDSETVMFGLDGTYAYNEAISFKGGIALNGSGDDGSDALFAIGAQYQITGGPALYAEIGNVNTERGSVETSEAFIGLGAKIDFGAARGTTFGQRSMFEAQQKF